MQQEIPLPLRKMVKQWNQWKLSNAHGAKHLAESSWIHSYWGTIGSTLSIRPFPQTFRFSSKGLECWNDGVVGNNIALPRFKTKHTKIHVDKHHGFYDVLCTCPNVELCNMINTTHALESLKIWRWWCQIDARKFIEKPQVTSHILKNLEWASPDVQPQPNSCCFPLCCPAKWSLLEVLLSSPGSGPTASRSARVRPFPIPHGPVIWKKWRVGWCQKLIWFTEMARKSISNIMVWCSIKMPWKNTCITYCKSAVMDYDLKTPLYHAHPIPANLQVLYTYLHIFTYSMTSSNIINTLKHNFSPPPVAIIKMFQKKHVIQSSPPHKRWWLNWNWRRPFCRSTWRNERRFRDRKSKVGWPTWTCATYPWIPSFFEKINRFEKFTKLPDLTDQSLPNPSSAFHKLFAIDHCVLRLTILHCKPSNLHLPKLPTN